MKLLACDAVLSGAGHTHNNAGTGTPFLLAHPKMRGAWPILANANNIRELA